MTTDKFWVVGQRYKLLNYTDTMTCKGFEGIHVVLVFDSGMEYLVGRHKRHTWMYKAVNGGIT